MEILETLITSVISLITLFILTRLMGHRSMGELSLFDYINGITIGSIAAEMATSMFTDITKPLIALIIYALVDIILSLLSHKSMRLRRFFTGKPYILYNHGTLYYKNLIKAKIDINEFLMLCRVNGYFDLAHIETVLLEANGQVSFLPASNQRPVTGSDLNLNLSQDHLVANVIIDGNIMKKNLAHAGHDTIWLHDQLNAQGITSLKEILLATCDANHNLRIYKKAPEEMKKDLLE